MYFKIIICAIVNVIILNAAPATIDTILTKMGADPRLQIYNTTLLSKNVMTFLDDCEKLEKPKQLLCQTYYDMLLTLSTDNINVTVDDINKQLNPVVPKSVPKFCEEFGKLIPSASKNNETNADVAEFSKIIRNPSKCTNICLAIDGSLELRITPMCQVISWGYSEHNKTKDDASPSKIIKIVTASPTSSDKNKTIEPVVNPEVEPVTESHLAAIQVISEAPGKKTAAPKSVNETIPTKPEHVVLPNVKPTEIILNKTTKSEPTRISEPSDADLETDAKMIDESNIADQGFDKTPPKMDEINDIDQQEDGDDDADDSNFETPYDDVLSIKPKNSNPSIPDNVESKSVYKADINTVTFGFKENDSNFFAYFLFVTVVCIVCYVVYHNKTKVLALVLEGRRANGGRGGFSKRKHTAAYRKLDSNLEEAITSNSNNGRSATQIIY